MQIKIKNKDIELEITYESKWWGSDFSTSEWYKFMPLIAYLFDFEEKFMMREPKKEGKKK